MSDKLIGNTSAVLMTKVIHGDAQIRSLHRKSRAKSRYV